MYQTFVDNTKENWLVGAAFNNMPETFNVSAWAEWNVRYATVTIIFHRCAFRHKWQPVRVAYAKHFQWAIIEECRTQMPSSQHIFSPFRWLCISHVTGGGSAEGMSLILRSASVVHPRCVDNHFSPGARELLRLPIMVVKSICAGIFTHLDTIKRNMIKLIFWGLLSTAMSSHYTFKIIIFVKLNLVCLVVT